MRNREGWRTKDWEKIKISDENFYFKWFAIWHFFTDDKRAHTQKYAQISGHAHTLTRTHAHTHTHACTHTHTWSFSQCLCNFVVQAEVRQSKLFMEWIVFWAVGGSLCLETWHNASIQLATREKKSCLNYFQFSLSFFTFISVSLLY